MTLGQFRAASRFSLKRDGKQGIVVRPIAMAEINIEGKGLLVKRALRNFYTH